MFYGGFCKVYKKLGKNEEEKTLAACISEVSGAIFFEFGMQTPLPGQHFCSNFGSNWIRDHRAT